MRAASLPEGWRISRLGSHLREPIRNGYSPVCPKEPTGKWILHLGAVTEEGFEPEAVKPAPPVDPRVDAARLEPGDVVVSRSNTRERVGLAGLYEGSPPACSYPDLLMRVRTSTDLDQRFLLHALLGKAGRRYFSSAARGTSGSMVKIDRALLEAFPLVLPPLPEQREIAATLKAVDDAIAAGEAVVEQVLQLRRALIEELVGNSTRPGVPISEIGAVSYGLTVDGARRKSPRVAPYLTVASVGAEGGFDLRALKEVGTFDGDTRYMLEAGDVLVIEGNANPKRIGVAAIWRGALAGVLHQNHLMRIRPDRAKVDPDWLCWALATRNCREQIEGRAKTTSGLHTINSTVLGSVRISLPTLPVQQEAVAALSTVDQRLRVERAVLAERRRLKTALADALLTGRIRVPVPDGV